MPEQEHLRSRSSTADGRIIIAGTGRTGTTLLIQLFTALGFDTGFTFEEAIAHVDPLAQTGLEHYSIKSDCNPYVFKSPSFPASLEEALQAGGVKIHSAIIPIRDLFAAAESRRQVHRAALERGLDPLVQPGSLWLTDDPVWQEVFLAMQFYKTLFPLVQFEVPIYFLEFPLFANDPIYLYQILEPLLSGHGVTAQELQEAHWTVTKPALIHEFGSAP